jgi:hypothetical protein
MPDQNRAAVDTAFFSVFTQTSLDLEGTRRQVAEQIGARLGEVEAQANRAAREASSLRDQAARVEHDYRSGDLSAANYERITAEVAAELEAAEAEAARLEEHTDLVERASGDIDGESETLRALADLRSQIAGTIGSDSSAKEVDALRAAVASLFEVVYVRPGDPAYGGYYLEPQVRRELVDALRPGDELAPVALGLSGPGNKLTGTGVPE